MTLNVRVYGCGSIGNHLANACRRKGWQVEMSDVDQAAMDRTKHNIYPERYGEWDEAISLTHVDSLENQDLDVVFIGTPPDSHLTIALDVLKQMPPKIMLIEKPAAVPDLAGCEELVHRARDSGTIVLVGYNHGLTDNTKFTDQLIGSGIVGEPLSISSEFREHLSGIFSAHPWLKGPEESYLGFANLGGGACGEHSHAIHIWQHMSHALKKGKIHSVCALMDWEHLHGTRYDRLSLLNVETEGGLKGNITQDFFSKPARKHLRIQCENGYIDWRINKRPDEDSVSYSLDGVDLKEVSFPKKRPDDFRNQIDHIEELMIDSSKTSPISLNRGLDVMLVIAAAHISDKEKRPAYIDYTKGYTLDAIKV